MNYVMESIWQTLLQPGLPVSSGEGYDWYKKMERETQLLFQICSFMKLSSFLNPSFCLSLNKEYRIRRVRKSYKPVSELARSACLLTPPGSSSLCLPSLVILRSSLNST